ncbi:MAG TPA: AglZ/HisF2 family acetamidino modification protein [Bacteroidales bacterium]|nr:AglZ/HisF2 family acetamidino modification protein [Bacteroidales bacterium]
MFKPRIIPVLLLRDNILVKSVRFAKHNYIGDPINAVKLFNDLEADELVFLDIHATKDKRAIPIYIIKEIGEEANMPFAIGGGITSIHQIKQYIKAGAEKVIIGSQAAIQPDFVFHAAEEFGSSTIAVCIDVKKNILGKQIVHTHNGINKTNYSPIEFAQLMQDKQAGEIIIQSIDRDGTMKGYDIELIQSISKQVTIPVVALGGAGSLQHLQQAFTYGYANGLAAGSLFVYHGSNKGVLINYPNKTERNQIFTQ